MNMSCGAGGSWGRSNSASWVDCMRVPLGLRIVIGLVVGRLLTTLASAVQKVLVLPVSAMAIVWDEVGGSTTSVVLRASGHEIISDKMGTRLGVFWELKTSPDVSCWQCNKADVSILCGSSTIIMDGGSPRVNGDVEHNIGSSEVHSVFH
jgi:hypothetical protein